MQRKTLLSACIALALSGQGWAADITEVETTTGEKKNTNVTCPADPGKLSPEELKRLPSECTPLVEQNLMPWLATGAAALITTLAVVELNDDDDHHHRNNSPLPPTPPDDDSDDTPVPPTPGGDEIIPDVPDDTPTPPKPISFNNDVILDKTEKTLTIRDSVFTYTENADGTISLQDNSGRKATINLWQIDEANNTVALEGVSADGTTKWRYNHNGELVITGDNATVNNNGKTTVDGKDSTGTEINGNNGKVIQDGDLDVSGGGHGIDISGDNAAVDNKGNMTVTDADSIGVLINGDNATLANTGDVDVSNSATGFAITSDEGKISLAGSMQVGDFSTGLTLTGDNNSLTMAMQDLNVVGQKATGINVSGDANTIDITGNILVDKDQSADNAAEYFYDASVGVNVSGHNNNVTLDGKLTLVADGETTTRDVSNFDGSQENISGLIVSGDGNNINLNGGIAFVGEINALTDGSAIANKRTFFGNTPLIGIDGESKVYLNGDSTISGDLQLGYASLIQLKNKAAIEIGSEATFNMRDIENYDHYYAQTPQIIKAESSSEVINNGNVDIWNISFAGIFGENTTGINNGNITLSLYDYASTNTPAPEPDNTAFLTSNGGSAVNKGVITSKVMEQHSVVNMAALTGSTDQRVFNNSVASMMGMEAYNKGSVLNAEDAVIDMYGRGSIGMLAIDNSTADNAGNITVDTLWIDDNDTTSLHTDLPGATAKDYGVGMATGTDTGGGARNNAIATNLEGGVITVYNAGAGMAAYGNSNMVINQGIINLEKNADYDANLGSNTLVGMAVYKGATAINDQTGVININVDTGQAFYNDGTGIILNYGEINLNGAEIDSTDSHYGAPAENLELLSELSASGENITKTVIRDGFVTIKPLANYGTEILNGDVDANLWLYNEDKASLTVNGDLNIVQGLENSGSMDADKLTANASVYNRASGSMTTELLMLKGGSAFFNEGSFSGVISGDSYKQNVVNTGEMTTVTDGSALINGSFVLYNEAGSTLTNSGNAIAGGENAIVNITRTSDSLSQVNRGKITATNGYSAIKTASTASNSNGKWIWNTETGVINGINPDAPLID
ncbi:beta strand repeat-containing protein, partial [Escherichia coli]